MHSPYVRKSSEIFTLFRVLGQLCVIGTIAGHAYCYGQCFPDVPRDHWAYKAVLELKNKGIFIGYPNGTFNGVLPKGMPKPQAAYDLSSPMITWGSLLRAMRNGDEGGISRILTKQCFLANNPPGAQFRSISEDRAMRVEYYRRTEILWRPMRLIDLRKYHDPGPDMFEGIFTSGDEPPFLRVHYVDMQRIGLEWHVTSIFPN